MNWMIYGVPYFENLINYWPVMFDSIMRRKNIKNNHSPPHAHVLKTKGPPKSNHVATFSSPKGPTLLQPSRAALGFVYPYKPL